MTTRNKNNLAPDSVTIQQWKRPSLASMASYLDAGQIDVLGSGLALFQSHLIQKKGLNSSEFRP